MNPERRECLRKMKYGAIMGAGVGSAAGFLFGSYEAFRYKGIPASQKIGLALRNTAGGGLVFGFFLAIGTAPASDRRGCDGRVLEDAKDPGWALNVFLENSGTSSE